MVFIESFILGLVFSLSSIGPISIEILRRSLKEGYLSAFGIIVGATIIDFLYLGIIFSGIYSFLNFSFVNKILTLFGIVFLLYLGYKSIREFRKFKLKKAKNVRRNSVVTGIILGISSPFAFVFYLGIFGPLVTSAGSLISGLTIGLTIIFGIFVGDNIKAVIGHLGKEALSEKFIKYASLIGGIALILFAFYFGYQFLTAI